jgi:hypothetical protein
MSGIYPRIIVITGILIDNSDQTPEETVDEIVQRLDVEPTA